MGGVVDYSNTIFNTMLISRTRYAISSTYSLVVGNIPYGKRHTSRTRTCVGASLVYWIKVYTHPIFFNKVPDHLDAFFNPRNASEKDAKNITPPSIGQIENRTSSPATDFV